MDEDGNRIKKENGQWEFDAISTTNWGRPEIQDLWREAWAYMVNAKFEEKGLDCRIDHRSYVDQGLDLIPTVHEGPQILKMLATIAALKEWISGSVSGRFAP